ncbi:hypothetical protein Agabi119p4_7952 [Agaricus bisporus var. burnettii]|uniref:HCP-like protein n=1 Tax=Agaricus bisporus var. burnettii TaxID=192524 RepID=A0A8H7C5D0_AGABI|nr:hypothetical protein Agabi119p4_7952 [Agaricus bisporus var. burnettii]
MMSAPPVPPRPFDRPDLPPPVPPVPPDLREQETRFSTPSPYEFPQFTPPLAASNVGSMAGTFDHQPGFIVPPPPPPQQQFQNRADWSPWAPPNAANLHPPRPPSIPQPLSRPQSAATPPVPTPPSLTAPLPTIANLQGALHAVQLSTHDPFLKIAWCRDVFALVDRSQQNPSPTTDPPLGPVTITDPTLHRLAHVAVPLILQMASSTQTPLPQYAAEAIYWRAVFATSGAYPEFITVNPRVAFRDFETAARGGYAAAWFRLGRDYENFKDTNRAKECFERGAKQGIESCAYRMGMAHLLGQLDLPVDPHLAIPLLSRAATLATTTVPQPAYVYALLLLNEFPQTSVPPSTFIPFIPQGSSPLFEARKHLERAAYLHFAPAQYKLGHAYEYAQPPFPFDPLLSVQYYSLASQQGEVEADMALSKWFLCGSGENDGSTGFEKDETLALTFAEKAARKCLPSAEFAMGYYAEVGVGRPKDIQNAIKWYTIAREHGNTDATDRLNALSQPSPQALSRQEHNTITDDKLIRKRTMAKERSDAVPHDYPPPNSQNGHLSAPGPSGRAVVDGIRRENNPAGPPRRMSPPRQPQPPLQQQPPPHQQPPLPQQPPFQQQQQHQQRPRYQSRPQQPQQASARPGYSLTDSPVPAHAHAPPPASPPAMSGSPAGRPQSQRPAVADAAPAGPKKPGPATFAEMGIQGAKARDEQCVIM